LDSETNNAAGRAELAERLEIVHNDQALPEKSVHPALKTVRTNR